MESEGGWERPPDYTPKGGTWRDDLHKAVQAEFEKKKNADAIGEDQFFVIERIEVWGNNPVREYKVTLGPPPGE
jgi:hypothetical protein